MSLVDMAKVFSVGLAAFSMAFAAAVWAGDKAVDGKLEPIEKTLKTATDTQQQIVGIEKACAEMASTGKITFEDCILIQYKSRGMPSAPP